MKSCCHTYIGSFLKRKEYILVVCRYALLVGTPPFETSTLKETYHRIANNKFTIPVTLSKPARSLITLLLHPNPKCRPQVWEIIQHEFFTSGYTPTALSSSCCTSPPSYSDHNLTR